MLAIDCHVHGCRVLIDWSRVEGARDGPEGTELDWRCWCGARGRLIGGVRSEPRDADVIVLTDAARASAEGRRQAAAGSPAGNVAG